LKNKFCIHGTLGFEIVTGIQTETT
jgi:hypothetical protein